MGEKGREVFKAMDKEKDGQPVGQEPLQVTSVCGMQQMRKGKGSTTTDRAISRKQSSSSHRKS